MDATYLAYNGAGYSGTAPGEKQVVLLPTVNYASGTRRCCVFAHGLLAGGWDWAIAAFELRTLAAMGIPCISADLGGPATWGNDTGQARITDAFNYMVTNHECSSDGFIGYGQSMGGPTMLNYMRLKPYNVVAFVGQVAGIGLKDLHDRSVANPTDPVIGAMGGSIEAAYGGTGGYNALIASHDPYTQILAHSILGIPMNLFVSDDDPVWTPAIANEFAATTGATLSSLGSIGHAVLPLGRAVEVGKWMRPFAYKNR